MARATNLTQGYALITMIVTGDSVMKDGRRCKIISKPLVKGLAMLIGAEENTIEIIKLPNIERGLQIEIHIYMNDTDLKQNKYEQMLIASNERHELSNIIK